MPNHVHGIILVGAQSIAPEPRPGEEPPIAGGEGRPALDEIVRTFKAASTRLIRTAGHEGFAWQRGYYEHVVRNDADLSRIRGYIERNPAKWGEDPENPAVHSKTTTHWMTGRLRA